MNALNRPGLDRAAALLLERLAAARLSARPPSAPTLILRSSSLGDFTVFLPFLASIVAGDPETRLLLVSRTGNVGATLLPHWRNRITVIDPGSRESMIAGVRGARASLGAVDFGRIIYAPQNSDQPAARLRRLLMMRAVAGVRAPLIGFDANPLLRSRWELERTPVALALNQALAPFAASGIAPAATRADCHALLGLTDDERSTADELLHTRGGDSTAPAVAMYVNAKDDRKRWPVERFIDVAREITRASGRQIWLIGGPEDVVASQRVAEALAPGRAIVLAGAANVRVTLALLRRCELFVGNDGSATHFAALSGCRCVTVFCNWEVPGIWEPIASPASRSLRPAWDAARMTGDFGIANIGTAHVLDAIADISATGTGHEIRTIPRQGAAPPSARVTWPVRGPLREPT